MSRRVALAGLILFAVPAFAFWVTQSDFASTTPYCPWGHRWGFTPQVCKVKDTQGARVLVEHANLDLNILELSIHEEGRTRWIQHPDGRVPRFSTKLDENIIKFDPNNKRMLLVNGDPFPITDIKK